MNIGAGLFEQAAVLTVRFSLTVSKDLAHYPGERVGCFVRRFFLHHYPLVSTSRR
jgi:hypothetical protein